MMRVRGGIVQFYFEVEYTKGVLTEVSFTMEQVLLILKDARSVDDIWTEIGDQRARNFRHWKKLRKMAAANG